MCQALHLHLGAAYIFSKFLNCKGDIEDLIMSGSISHI